MSIRVWYSGYGESQVVINCDCNEDWRGRGFEEIQDLSGFYGEEAFASSSNTVVNSDGSYTYASQYNIEEHKEVKQEELKQNCSDAAYTLTRKYSEIEQQSWPTQLEEASLWSADSSASTPMLDSILANCQGTGVTKEGLVATILENSANFKAACAAIVGQRIAKRDSITACTTRIQLESLDLSISIGE